jgi:pyruvate formate lyase activating enzyme
MWIRFVLVPGLTDDPDNVASIAKFASTLGNVERVDVLPFHQLGRFKWKELGLNYKLDSLPTPAIESVASVLHQFRSQGLKAY